MNSILQKGGSIVVLSLKGGPGKSTTVSVIASILGEENCSIVCLDTQRSIGSIASRTKRFNPVEDPKKADKNVIIYDTPPYLNKDFISICKNSKLILMPCRIGYTDLLATKDTYLWLEKNHCLRKTVAFFNAIRLPLSNYDKNLMEAYRKNYKSLKIAEHFLAQRNAYKEVFTDDLSGKSLIEAKNLLHELNII